MTREVLGGRWAFIGYKYNFCFKIYIIFTLQITACIADMKHSFANGFRFDVFQINFSRDLLINKSVSDRVGGDGGLTREPLVDTEVMKAATRLCWGFSW